MAFKKFTRADGPAEPLSPQQHEAAKDALRKLKKTSAKDLSAQERDSFRVTLDKTP